MKEQILTCARCGKQVRLKGDVFLHKYEDAPKGWEKAYINKHWVMLCPECSKAFDKAAMIFLRGEE